jgi:hypothetical protein
MHVTRRASGLETRPDIARGIITRAFLVSRCCCSEFYCKARAFSFSDDIDESCTYLRSPSAQRSSRRQSKFRCAAIRCAGYGEPNAIANAISYAKFRSRSHDAVIRVYDEADNVIETHEHVGDFKVCEARQTKSRHAVKRDG